MNELAKARQERLRLRQPLLDLTESNPTRCGFEYHENQLVRAFQDPRLALYEPNPRGLLSARRAVMEYYAERGLAIQPEQIFLTASTSEAYSFVFRLLCDSGDCVLAPRPGYPLLEYLASLNDLGVDGYPLRYEDRWQIDREALTSGVRERSRALLVVHPNNPTGSYALPEEVDFLARLCKERKMALIADEVFWDYAHPATAGSLHSFARENSTLTFTLSGLSKISGLPQMKCAWIVVTGPPAVQHEAIRRMEVIADTFLSVSTPVALAFPSLLELRRSIGSQILERVLSNLALLDQQISGESPISRLHVEGGWYAILRLPRILTDEDWALLFLRKEGVAVHPGHFYDFPDDGYVVVSLLPSSEIFVAAIRKLFATVIERC
ncbi:MAG: pyridoxal phosphate-dependent aminotransferase [Terriglobia bacterium]